MERLHMSLSKVTSEVTDKQTHVTVNADSKFVTAPGTEVKSKRRNRRMSSRQLSESEVVPSTVMVRLG